MTEDSQDGKPSATASVSQRAADHVRGTAKWLVSSMGALAAALIASVSLSDAGALEGADLVLAGLAFAVGICAAVGALLVMADILGPHTTSLSRVAADADLVAKADAEDSGWLSGFPSVNDLVAAFNAAAAERVEARTSEIAAFASKDAAAMEEATHRREQAEARLEAVNPAVDRLLAIAGAESLGVRWKRARWSFAGLVVVSAAAAFVFAALASSNEESGDAVRPEPVHATIRLSAKGQESFGHLLGDRCPIDRELRAIATASEGESVTVRVSDRRCVPAEISLKPEEASVSAVRQG